LNTAQAVFARIGFQKFQTVQRQVLEITQRGVTAAKVVDCQRHPEGTQRFEHAGGLCHVVQHLACGDLQFQPCRRQCAGGQRIAYCGDDVVVGNLTAIALRFGDQTTEIAQREGDDS